MLEPDSAEWVFDFCEALTGRAEEDGLYSLSEPEQRVVLAWSTKGIIDNGGFQYFYEGATHAQEVADAYEAIGLPQLAEACRKSLHVFPNHHPPEPQERMWKWMAEQDQSVSDYWDEWSAVIWHCSYEELQSSLGRYICSLRAAFADAPAATT